MNEHSILMVGPLPPPYNGQSVSFQMLVDNISKVANVRLVSLSGKNIGKSGGKASLKRVFDYISICSNFFIQCVQKTDVVYITIAQSRHGFYRDFYFIWVAYLLGRKIVIHLKGGNYGGFYSSQSAFLKKLIRFTLLKAETILVLGKNLVSMYDFEPRLKEKIRIVENGLPFELSKVLETKSIKSVEQINVLFLSNLIESKGYFDVLEAISLFKKKYGTHNLKYHLAGNFLSNVDDINVKNPGHAKELFFEKVKALGLDGQVIHHGVVSGAEKKQLLNDAHIFTLPTNYINEGQPVSIIEALAYATPVIATNYRAISDMVIEGKTGCFVGYRQPEELADKIYEILKNHKKYSQMSSNAYSLYEEKFTMKKHLERIQPYLLYSSVLSSHQF